MSNTITHPTLTLLGLPLETSDGDFVDMADVQTALGHVGFSRAGGRWGWNLVTVMREADDFDDVVGGSDSPTLEDAVANAERTLSPLATLVVRGLMAEATLDRLRDAGVFVDGEAAERLQELIANPPEPKPWLAQALKEHADKLMERKGFAKRRSESPGSDDGVQIVVESAPKLCVGCRLAPQVPPSEFCIDCLDAADREEGEKV